MPPNGRRVCDGPHSGLSRTTAPSHFFVIASSSDLISGAQLYWAVSILASVLLAFIVIGSFMGRGSDFNGPPQGTNKASTVKLFSLRTLVSFFVGFGWTGVAAGRQSMPPTATAGIAVISGVVFLLLIFALMRMLISKCDD